MVRETDKPGEKLLFMKTMSKSSYYLLEAGIALQWKMSTRIPKQKSVHVIVATNIESLSLLISV